MTTRDASRLRALVVDDHDTNRLILRMLLEDDGYGVAEAVDGLGAIQAFTGSPFDLVLMDIQMPGMDGHDATRAMRALERQRGSPRTPVIVISAFCGSADLAASAAAGADLHMPKPLDVAKVLTACRQMTDAGMSTRPSAIARSA